jgi:hypothetical protein
MTLLDMGTEILRGLFSWAPSSRLFHALNGFISATWWHFQIHSTMSDEERRRSVSRERSPAGDREKHPDVATDDQKPEETPKVEFKCFVGGIPWQMNDSGLRESK